MVLDCNIYVLKDIKRPHFTGISGIKVISLKICHFLEGKLCSEIFSSEAPRESSILMVNEASNSSSSFAWPKKLIQQPWEWLVTIVKSGYSSQGRYAKTIHYSGVSSFCISVSWPTWLRYHLTANSWSKTNTTEPSNSARIPQELFSEDKTNRGRSFYGERHSLRMNLLDTLERFQWSFRYLGYFFSILFRPRF